MFRDSPVPAFSGLAKDTGGRPRRARCKLLAQSPAAARPYAPDQYGG